MKFRDVAHFYIGSDIQTKSGVFKLIGTINGELILDTDVYGAGAVENDAKPILLSLEDMTNEHRTELQNLTVFGDWPEISKKFHYLTSKGYDVFGLIESGEAIRKTK